MEDVKNNGGRPAKIGDVVDKKDKLVLMAKKGASKCQLYVEMGITKGCASRWSNPDDDRYQVEFVNLIDELETYSQAFWEELGQKNLLTKDFQSTVYNKQLQGRFKRDWSPHHTADIVNKTEDKRQDVDLTILNEDELNQYEKLLIKLSGGIKED